MESPLSFTKEKGIDYPIGLLKDIKIYFQHYKTEQEAQNKWNERKTRINYDNIFVLFTDRDGCSYNDLTAFDNLPFKNKIVFTKTAFPEIKSAMYISGFEEMDSVGMCYEYMPDKPYMKYYDQFDYVSWFNGKYNSMD